MVVNWELKPNRGIKIKSWMIHRVSRLVIFLCGYEKAPPLFHMPDKTTALQIINAKNPPILSFTSEVEIRIARNKSQHTVMCTYKLEAGAIQQHENAPPLWHLKVGQEWAPQTSVPALPSPPAPTRLISPSTRCTTQNLSTFLMACTIML